MPLLSSAILAFLSLIPFGLLSYVVFSVFRGERQDFANALLIEKIAVKVNDV